MQSEQTERITVEEKDEKRGPSRQRGTKGGGRKEKKKEEEEEEEEKKKKKKRPKEGTSGM